MTRKSTPEFPIPEQVWKTEDVMKFLGVTRQQVYILVKKGLPHSATVCNAYRFHPGAVARWFEEQQKTR